MNKVVSEKFIEDLLISIKDVTVQNQVEVALRLLVETDKAKEKTRLELVETAK